MKISNNTIVALLIIAVVLSLAGSLFSLNKLNLLSLKYDALTGAAVNSSTGTSTITVQSRTQITNRISTMAFGSGYVNSTCSNCTMSSINGTDITARQQCCVGFNNVTYGFLLENTGNENLSINFSCSGSCNASMFINGTSPVFRFRMQNASDAVNKSADSTADTASSCDSGDGGGWNYSGGNPNNGVGWTTMREAFNETEGFQLCGRAKDSLYFLAPDSNKDAGILDFWIEIPADARPNVQQTATLTFGATSSG